MSTISLHARHHRLIDTAHAASPELHVLGLIFHKAYERAAFLIDAGPVLDLGCNTGYGTAILRERTPHEVIGVDVSPAAIDAARRRWGGDFRVIDGRTLPFEDATFAAVTCFQVIEHIEDTPAFLAEIRRVLRPGGLGFFTTPNAATRLDHPDQKPWYRYHVREYTAAGLRRLLDGYFEEVAVEGLFGTPPLERIERARVARLRKIGRLRRPVGWMLPVPVEDRLIAGVRRLRGLLPGGPAAGPGAAASLTTGDLRFERDDLDDALDLAAVCRR